MATFFLVLLSVAELGKHECTPYVLDARVYVHHTFTLSVAGAATHEPHPP